MIAVFPAAGRAKVGESAIRVRVRDSTGTPGQAGEGDLQLHDGHACMTIETTEANEMGDGVYEGTTRFTMSGPWSFIVQIDRPVKQTLRERFVVRKESPR